MSAPAIHVRGSGIVALAAAIAYRRALPGTAVTLIADDASNCEWGAAGPILAEFHRKIGLDHKRFVDSCTVTEVHTTCFDNWSDRKLSFCVPEQGEEEFIDGAALHQLWLRRAADGEQSDIARLLSDPSAPPGYRFDAAAYRALLTRMAEAIGVERRDDPPLGEPLLLCDASQGCENPSDWDDWSNWLPAYGPAAIEQAQAGSPTVERIEREGDALICTAPGRIARFEQARGVRSGRRSQAWIGRRTHFGDGAIALPPIMGLPLSTALTDILRAIRFVPPDGAIDAVANEFNRQTAAAHIATLEWASAPFLLSSPEHRTAWPSGLDALTAQFRYRGRVPLREDDPVSRGRWIAMLAGLGLRPERIDPTALALDAKRADQILARAAGAS